MMDVCVSVEELLCSYWMSQDLTSVVCAKNKLVKLLLITNDYDYHVVCGVLSQDR